MEFKYTILQIDTKKDTNNYAFMRSEFLIQHKDSVFPPPIELYSEVYSGTQAKISPEDLFVIFNSEIPNDYTGRSLSTSDIIRYELPNGKQLYMYCDDWGFKGIDIDGEHKFAKEPKFIEGTDDTPHTVILYYQNGDNERQITIDLDKIYRKKFIGTDEEGKENELTMAEILISISLYASYLRNQNINTIFEKKSVFEFFTELIS